MIESENKPSETEQQEGNSSSEPAPRIILADDGSKHAQAAVNLLCDLPLPPDSMIHVLAVVPNKGRSASINDKRLCQAHQP
jgi:hypothetical protein